MFNVSLYFSYLPLFTTFFSDGNKRTKVLNRIVILQLLQSQHLPKMARWLLVVAPIAAKMVLNICAPGTSPFVDFLKAGICLTSGDMVGFFECALSGAGDLVTLGLSSSAKEVIKSSAEVVAKAALEAVTLNGRQEGGLFYFPALAEIGLTRA